MLQLNANNKKYRDYPIINLDVLVNMMHTIIDTNMSIPECINNADYFGYFTASKKAHHRVFCLCSQKLKTLHVAVLICDVKKAQGGYIITGMQKIGTNNRKAEKIIILCRLGELFIIPNKQGVEYIKKIYRHKNTVAHPNNSSWGMHGGADGDPQAVPPDPQAAPPDAANQAAASGSQPAPPDAAIQAAASGSQPAPPDAANQAAASGSQPALPDAAKKANLSDEDKITCGRTYMLYYILYKLLKKEPGYGADNDFMEKIKKTAEKWGQWAGIFGDKIESFDNSDFALAEFIYSLFGVGFNMRGQKYDFYSTPLSNYYNYFEKKGIVYLTIKQARKILKNNLFPNREGSQIYSQDTHAHMMGADDMIEFRKNYRDVVTKYINLLEKNMGDFDGKIDALKWGKLDTDDDIGIVFPNAVVVQDAAVGQDAGQAVGEQTANKEILILREFFYELENFFTEQNGVALTDKIKRFYESNLPIIKKINIALSNNETFPNGVTAYMNIIRIMRLGYDKIDTDSQIQKHKITNEYVKNAIGEVLNIAEKIFGNNSSVIEYSVMTSAMILFYKNLVKKCRSDTDDKSCSFIRRISPDFFVKPAQVAHTQQIAPPNTAIPVGFPLFVPSGAQPVPPLVGGPVAPQVAPVVQPVSPSVPPLVGGPVVPQVAPVALVFPQVAPPVGVPVVLPDGATSSTNVSSLLDNGQIKKATVTQSVAKDAPTLSKDELEKRKKLLDFFQLFEESLEKSKDTNYKKIKKTIITSLNKILRSKYSTFKDDHKKFVNILSANIADIKSDNMFRYKQKENKKEKEIKDKNKIALKSITDTIELAGQIIGDMTDDSNDNGNTMKYILKEMVKLVRDKCVGKKGPIDGCSFYEETQPLAAAPAPDPSVEKKDETAGEESEYMDNITIMRTFYNNIRFIANEYIKSNDTKYTRYIIKDLEGTIEKLDDYKSRNTKIQHGSGGNAKKTKKSGNGVKKDGQNVKVGKKSEQSVKSGNVHKPKNLKSKKQKRRIIFDDKDACIVTNLWCFSGFFDGENFKTGFIYDIILAKKIIGETNNFDRYKKENIINIIRNFAAKINEYDTPMKANKYYRIACGINKFISGEIYNHMIYLFDYMHKTHKVKYAGVIANKLKEKNYSTFFNSDDQIFVGHLYYCLRYYDVNAVFLKYPEDERDAIWNIVDTLQTIMNTTYCLIGQRDSIEIDDRLAENMVDYLKDVIKSIYSEYKEPVSGKTNRKWSGYISRNIIAYITKYTKHEIQAPKDDAANTKKIYGVLNEIANSANFKNFKCGGIKNVINATHDKISKNEDIISVKFSTNQMKLINSLWSYKTFISDHVMYKDIKSDIISAKKIISKNVYDDIHDKNCIEQILKEIAIIYHQSTDSTIVAYTGNGDPKNYFRFSEYSDEIKMANLNSALLFINNIREEYGAITKDIANKEYKEMICRIFEEITNKYIYGNAQIFTAVVDNIKDGIERFAPIQKNLIASLLYNIENIENIKRSDHGVNFVIINMKRIFKLLANVIFKIPECKYKPLPEYDNVIQHILSHIIKADKSIGPGETSSREAFYIYEKRPIQAPPAKDKEALTSPKLIQALGSTDKRSWASMADDEDDNKDPDIVTPALKIVDSSDSNHTTIPTQKGSPDNVILPVDGPNIAAGSIPAADPNLAAGSIPDADPNLVAVPVAAPVVDPNAVPVAAPVVAPVVAPVSVQDVAQVVVPVVAQVADPNAAQVDDQDAAISSPKQNSSTTPSPNNSPPAQDSSIDNMTAEQIAKLICTRYIVKPE